jgi:hypothetical protein
VTRCVLFRSMKAHFPFSHFFMCTTHGNIHQRGLKILIAISQHNKHYFSAAFCHFYHSLGILILPISTLSHFPPITLYFYLVRLKLSATQIQPVVSVPHLTCVWYFAGKNTFCALYPLSAFYPSLATIIPFSTSLCVIFRALVKWQMPPVQWYDEYKWRLQKTTYNKKLLRVLYV